MLDPSVLESVQTIQRSGKKAFPRLRELALAAGGIFYVYALRIIARGMGVEGWIVHRIARHAAGRKEGRKEGGREERRIGRKEGGRERGKEGRNP